MFTPAGTSATRSRTAKAVTLPNDGAVTATGSIGDGANGTKDVDLYQVTLGAGEQLSVG